MLLKRWEDLPNEMQNPEVRKYYDILSKKKTSLALKRAFDVTASFSMLIALSPVFAALAAAIKADSKGTVFFRQERVTQYGRKFRIHKFRSMVQGAESGSQITVSGDKRVTKTGAFIRKYKLDEISQLLDVLKGDMTFVGTRPEIQKYVQKYTDEMKATLLLPAGITSTASVCYKDESSLLDASKDTEKTYTEQVLPDKMRYNLRDIEQFSLAHDIKIMLMTVFAVLGKDYGGKGGKTEKKKPLIALLTNNDDDIYCFRKELIEALISEGYDVLISCPYGEKFKLLSDLKYIYDDPFIDRRGTNPINDSKLFIHYLRLFKKHKPDVVLTYTAKPNVYGSIAAHILNIPVINNVTGFGSVLNKGNMMQKFVMQLFKTAYRKSKCVMFQNKTNMSLAEKTGMVKGKRKLIPGSGVDTERFPLQPYPSGGNGIDGETVVFNYIGRILHDKGVDDYIENAERIKTKYPNTQFNMLGFIEQTERHYKDELEELEKKGIVHYLGSQQDVRPFIAASHATIHPSTYGEGMSNVLLESASSGRVLIDTKSVLEAAGTKWNFLKFYPGLVGGHCIGVDPYYLTYKAEMLGYHSQIILSGRRINDDMGKYVAENVVKNLISSDKAVKNAKVAILGFTFKENCPDTRNTKIIDIVNELYEYGITPVIADPVADADEAERLYGMRFADISQIKDMDAVVLAVAHDEFKKLTMTDISSFFGEGKKVLVDIKGLLDREEYENAGYSYWRL